MTRMPAYLQRIRDAVNAGLIPRDNLTSVEVEHGRGCMHHRNRATPCTCHPRITAIVGDETLVIGSGGAVLERRKRQ